MIKELKLILHGKLGLHWQPNANEIKATYIPLICVGVWHCCNTNFSNHVVGNANFSVFRYQHGGVGGPNQVQDPTRVVLRRSRI